MRKEKRERNDKELSSHAFVDLMSASQDYFILANIKKHFIIHNQTLQCCSNVTTGYVLYRWKARAYSLGFQDLPNSETEKRCILRKKEAKRMRILNTAEIEIKVFY